VRLGTGSSSRFASDDKAVLERMVAALGRDPRFAFHERLPTLSLADGILTVAGEVDDVRTKKLTLELLAAEPRVEFVVDRLCVTPVGSMGDAVIRDHLVAMILGDTTFDECAVEVLADGAVRRVREARAESAQRGTIRIAVSNGVVTLDGTVPSRNHRRLAAALAWWIPGTRDVQALLGPGLPEDFDELDLVDGVRLVLEKDPLVDAGQIEVRARDTTVTLFGTVRSAGQRAAAEHDAWFVPDVGDVVNRIEVLQ
jgi:hypothetical protein